MPCHPIYDFVLSITTSNVVWWDKNGQSMFQEEVNRVENHAMSETRWKQSIEILLRLYFSLRLQIVFPEG
jgi:hypothetical protein